MVFTTGSLGIPESSPTPPPGSRGGCVCLRKEAGESWLSSQIQLPELSAAGYVVTWAGEARAVPLPRSQRPVPPLGLKVAENAATYLCFGSFVLYSGR